MSCDCFNKANATLAVHNECLVSLMDIRSFEAVPRALISIEKLDSKKRTRPRRMLASFCPFCGTAYEKLPRSGKAGVSPKKV